MGVVRGSYGVLPLTLARIRLSRCGRRIDINGLFTLLQVNFNYPCKIFSEK
jgi:hypothetical protein